VEGCACVIQGKELWFLQRNFFELAAFWFLNGNDTLTVFLISKIPNIFPKVFKAAR